MAAAASTAAWLQKIAGSLKRNEKLVNSRYLQLATVTPAGRPANRTVVFRGFEGENLSFITDVRSKKVQEIAKCEFGEAAWYFPDSREQFRIAGKLSVVGADEPAGELQAMRGKLWGRISDGARQQFAWPDPSLPRDKDPAAHKPDPPAAESPLDTFCLVLLKPESVDHLSLRDNQRFVSVLGGDGSWTETEMNP